MWAATATLPALIALTLGLGPARPAPPGRGRLPDLPQVRRDSGKKKFEEQLGQAMPLIASNLRAGRRSPGDRAGRREHERPHKGPRFRRLASDIRAGTPVPSAGQGRRPHRQPRPSPCSPRPSTSRSRRAARWPTSPRTSGQTVPRPRRGPQDHPLQDLAEPHRVADHGRPARLHDGRAPHDSRRLTASSTASPPAGRSSRWRSCWTRWPTS